MRVLVALGISLVAGSYFYARSRNAADLTLINFGSEALLNGGNPYRLAGPGMVFDAPWGSLYPATAYVVGIPLLFVSETSGTVVFLCLSTFLLAFGATREGWFRLPMFLSIPFMWSAMQVQWTILFSAAVFLPWIACIASVKPQTAIPVIAGAENPRHSIIAALIGSLVLLAVSLMLLPTWPLDWITVVRSGSSHIEPAVMQTGGFLIPLVLLRWRSRDAWLVMLMALLPQTPYPYSVLPLLTIAKTFRESLFLSFASLGLLATNFLPGDIHSLAMVPTLGMIAVLASYLPAVAVVVLRRSVERKPALSGRLDF